MMDYRRLEAYLAARKFAEIPMTFNEIESVLGQSLPPSAYKHRPWWANGGSGHSHANAWLRAGYKTARVDMSSKRLVFRRRDVRPGMHEEPQPFTGADQTAWRSPLFGALKGTFTIQPGHDLCSPALDDEEWASLRDEHLSKFESTK